MTEPTPVYNVTVTDHKGGKVTHRQVPADAVIEFQLNAVDGKYADIKIERTWAWSADAVTGGGRFGCD